MVGESVDGELLDIECYGHEAVCVCVRERGVGRRLF